MTTSSYSIQRLPFEERPRERLAKQGPEALSSAELIAVLLGSGTKTTPVLQLAQELIMHFGTLKNVAEATIEELCQIKGLGFAKATQLKAAFSVSQRVAQQSNEIPKFRIGTPLHAYNLVRDTLEHEKREIFLVVFLDIQNFFTGLYTVAIGTLTRLLVHPREVFYPAIRHKAFRILIAHNHPSGDPTPSKEDYETTHQLREASHIVGIPIADHIIVAGQKFTSMKEMGFKF